MCIKPMWYGVHYIYDTKISTNQNTGFDHVNLIMGIQTSDT